MYRSRHLGSLGQTPGFNPNANCVPGQQYVLNFGIAVSLLGEIDAGLIETVLQQSFPLFSNGALKLVNVNVGGSTLSVTILANASAAIVTLGAIESSITNTLNDADIGLTFTPLDMAGGQGTTFSTQFAQEGGLTLSPLAPTSPGGTNWLVNAVTPSFLSDVPAWALWAGAGAVALVIVYALR